MGSAMRILKRFISATMLISVFLLIINFVLLGVWGFTGMNKGQSPMAVVQNVAAGLQRTNNTYSLASASADLLEKNLAWAMLINDTGHVEWKHQAPDELPSVYSLTDMAKLSRSYLLDYPVFIWEHEAGIVVVGYPKESLAKYQHILPTDRVSSLPLKLTALFIINIVLVLLLSVLIGSRLIRSIHPLTKGIQALAKGNEAYVEPKGILTELARSVNGASALLQQRNDSLKSRDEARSNWIAGISHDIRTPLSMVLGYSSELEENGDIPPKQRQQAGIIRQQAELLRSLVRDLNLVSMLEYEMQPLNKKTIHLSVLARQIASEFLNNGLDERFELEISLDDKEDAQIYGDERLLTRAMSNLIHNCIRHNPDGCRIRLNTSSNKRQQSCSFIVADNGKGVPQHELADLLELPYSSKRKHPRQNGHGLGLPMVARIARAHQGQLILTSDVGAGFQAELMLPSRS